MIDLLSSLEDQFRVVFKDTAVQLDQKTEDSWKAVRDFKNVDDAVDFVDAQNGTIVLSMRQK